MSLLLLLGMGVDEAEAAVVMALVSVPTMMLLNWVRQRIVSVAWTDDPKAMMI